MAIFSLNCALTCKNLGFSNLLKQVVGFMRFFIQFLVLTCIFVLQLEATGVKPYATTYAPKKTHCS